MEMSSMSRTIITRFSRGVVCTMNEAASSFNEKINEEPITYLSSGYEWFASVSLASVGRLCAEDFKSGARVLLIHYALNKIPGESTKNRLPIKPGFYIVEAVADQNLNGIGRLRLLDSNGRSAYEMDGEVRLKGGQLKNPTGRIEKLDLSLNYEPDLAICADVSWKNEYSGGYSEYSITACLTLV